MPAWFDRLFQKRDVRLSGFPSLAALLGAGPTSSGIVVTPEKALTVPAVFACLQVLSQDVGKTPIKLRQKIGPDTYVDAVDHDLYEILYALPNPETSAYSFKQSMMIDLLTYERAYAEVVRVDGRVVALWRLDPTRMLVDRDPSRRKRYRYFFGPDEPSAHRSSQSIEWLFDPSMPPILELQSPSPLRYCKELIGAALALQVYVGKFFSNGARLGGVLQSDRALSVDSTTRLRQSFESWYGGLENSHRFAVLEEGLKYQQVAAPNDSAQLNETLATIRIEIAGAFRVPPWKVGDLSKATYSNMESGENAYVNGTLDPLFALWEEAIRRDLLTTRQYGQFDVSFDRSTLIRNDIKSQHEALARARDAGIYSANDIRRKLGENPIPASEGGNLYLVNGNMIPVTTAGQAKGTSGNGQP